MPLSTSQNLALKAAILADPALLGMVQTGQYQQAANLLNAQAAPSFTVWRTDVTAEETGNAWVGTDIDGMSALNMQRLQLLFASSPAGVFDMSRADRRAGFENPFGTNVNNASRVAMRTVWKRLASTFEKILSTGTGSDASPATMGVVGPVTATDIGNAL